MTAVAKERSDAQIMFADSCAVGSRQATENAVSRFPLWGAPRQNVEAARVFYMVAEERANGWGLLAASC